MTNFHHSYTGVSRHEDSALFRVVATIMTADEFEKEAHECNDDPKKNSIKGRRSATLISINKRLEKLHWVDTGSLLYPSGLIIQNASRYMLSFLGGFALLVPMTIMVLHPGRFTALVTTIISVFIVALGLSLPTPLRQVGPSDTFTGVAIYSAVLVVFVGASTTSDASKINKRDKDVASGLLGGTFIALVLCGVWTILWRVTDLQSKPRHGRTDHQTGEV